MGSKATFEAGLPLPMGSGPPRARAPSCARRRGFPLVDIHQPERPWLVLIDLKGRGELAHFGLRRTPSTRSSAP